MTWGILDFETETHPFLGSKSSPHSPLNYIVAVGFALDNNDVQDWYHNNADEANASNWADTVFGPDVHILVAHNATFEIQWLLSHRREQFLAFIKRGGRIFCTQYAEYLLTHQQTQYATLEDCAIKYGGTKKIDEVKLLWEQGVLTSAIEPALLRRYLAGPSGDIENTRTVCFTQYAHLVQAGMIDGFWERMDSLLFNAVCTHTGLYINREVAAKNHKAQLIEADALRIELMKQIPADKPDELEFNFGSGHMMSAWLFGGPIAYRYKVHYDTPTYVKVDCITTTEGVKVLLDPVTALLCDGDNRLTKAEYCDKYWVNFVTYKSGKNKGTIKITREDTKELKMKWGEATYEFPGLINIAELPPHVQELYTGKNAEYQGKQTLLDGTPVYSTGKDSLDTLAAFSPLVVPLKRLTNLDKDNGTYYISHEYNADGSIHKTKGMLQFVRPNGIVNHSLNGVSTVTTRLSSSCPNLQNLPREGTSLVKQMFSSRFGADGQIVEVDYSALEVVDLAAIAGDFNLLGKLAMGVDMHCLRLSEKLGEDYDEVVEKCNNKEHPDHKHYKEMRTDIKRPSFAFQYGASDKGVSYASGCSLEAAVEFRLLETSLFPEAVGYKYIIMDEVERTGILAPMCKEVNDGGYYTSFRRGHFQAKGGTCYSFRQYMAWDKEARQEILKYKETQVANYVIQGEASFIVQTACGRVIRWLVANDFFGGNVLCVNTVHDAIYLDCVNEEWARWAGNQVAEIMASTPKYMCDKMPGYKAWRYDTTPFPAVAEFGSNMMEKTHC